MLTTHSEGIFARQADLDGSTVPLHNVDRPEQENAIDSENSTPPDAEGRWGERDAGAPVSMQQGMEEYEELRKELTRLSTLRSRPAAGRDALWRSVTGASRATVARTRTREASVAASVPADEIDESQQDDFALGDFLREGHFEKRTDGRSAKKIGVTFKHLTVKGFASSATKAKTLPKAVLGTFGPDLYRLITGLFPVLRPRSQQPLKEIIHDFTGGLRDGEMMLVLGRPGSGCSTFLKTVANNRAGYAEVTGDVKYGGISAKEQAKRFRGEVTYNAEDDQHFATLTVWQTLKFALSTKTRKQDKEEVPILINALLKMFGLPHTANTLVGNEYVRGVSGGERKRVSITEMLATKATVVCWDNSTRGLDASTALDFAKSLRLMTDISNRTTFVTLYQAGEAIYQLMDKVLVIDEGRMIYQGPAKEAQAYFEQLGYHCPDRETTADFLTSITDPAERLLLATSNAVPKTAQDLEAAFKNSPHYARVLQDLDAYEKELEQSNFRDAQQFRETVQEGKSGNVQKQSSFTVSFFRQVLACTQREFWLIFGDRTSLYTKFFIILANALIIGSMFHGQTLGTQGAFSRSGTLFMSSVFLGWLQLSELMRAVSGRTVIARHKEYALYRPSAVALARVLTDFPIILTQTVLLTIILYWITDLDVVASKYFIYVLFVYVITLTCTALYRMFAALSPSINDAVRFAGLSLNLLVVYTGYVIPRRLLISKYIWFGWLYWVNPFSYTFEGLMTNEFSDRTMQCTESQVVPRGPGYDNPAYQGCSIAGARPGNLSVSGSDYLETQFGYSRRYLWRNFGAVIAFGVLYMLVTVAATELLTFAGAGQGALILGKARKGKARAKPSHVDEERVIVVGGEKTTATSGGSSSENTEGDLTHLTKSEAIFTWKDVQYTVPYVGGERKILNGVSGYAKPGIMVALMGASGAGKTTLLNTLAQRQTVGVVQGEMLVDGRPLGADFQRGTGFCEQMDLHDGTQTVREAIEFSAILRQEPTVPRQEKIAYVDTIIDLLELGEIEDVLVASLGVEQRKRLTIGVELAAKPSLLLFLDEPTSGLDSQSALSIVRFLKKLAKSGQAIVCTIHQPSSVLIQEFDMILALNPGGNTFYFGPVGDFGSEVVKYFSDRGFPCPDHKNVAEFILETAAKSKRRADGTKVNWNEEWLKSENHRLLLEEIDRIKTERRNVQHDATKITREFASPIWLQTVTLTKRMFVQYWRDPSYLYGKLFVSVVIAIFNGFTFFELGNSILDMQNRMFTSFLIILLPPVIVNSVVPKFFQNRALWEAREHPARVYGWVAFCTANIVCEIPMAIVGSVLYWVIWYFATGLPRESSVSGYVFLMTMLYFLFITSWGQWICAFAPSFTVISNVLPFFFVMTALFNGVVQPYYQLSVFWRYWMYYVNPYTYWVGGVIAATLDGTPIRCSPEEVTRFNVPAGQTCGSYAGAFADRFPGYLINPSDTSNCGYCPLSSGNEFMETLNIRPEHKWRNMGIFLAFCVTNWALVYFFIYTVRIRGYSFGFGKVLGLLGFAFGAVANLVRKVMPSGKK